MKPFTWNLEQPGLNEKCLKTRSYISVLNWMMKVPDISKYAILEKNSSLKVISKIISISDSSIYCFQRLSKFSSHVYFASSFATSPYQALKFKLYFRLIYLWHSRPSLCLQNQETIYQHIFFSKIPKVTIWRKQQKHWRAKKGCWRMSGIGWTATPWFVILLITYFYFTLYPYLFVNMFLFCWEGSVELRRTPCFFSVNRKRQLYF